MSAPYIRSAPAALIMCVSVVGACASPSKDYDDFRARVGTADVSADTQPAETASGDGSVFDEAGVAAFSGTYWGACLDAAYADDVDKVTYDVFVFNFSGSAGAVQMSGTRQGVLVAGSNISQVTGEVVTLASTPVTADGSFAVKVARFIEPKEANAFGIDLTVDQGQYAFTMRSTDGGCGKFTGRVTSPLAQDVNETCVFARPKPDGSFPRFTNAKDLHCP